MRRLWRWLFPEWVPERGLRVFPYEVKPLPKRPSGGGDIPPVAGDAEYKVERGLLVNKSVEFAASDDAGPGGPALAGDAE